MEPDNVHRHPIVEECCGYICNSIEQGIDIAVTIIGDDDDVVDYFDEKAEIAAKKAALAKDAVKKSLENDYKKQPFVLKREIDTDWLKILGKEFERRRDAAKQVETKKELNKFAEQKPYSDRLPYLNQTSAAPGLANPMWNTTSTLQADRQKVDSPLYTMTKLDGTPSHVSRPYFLLGIDPIDANMNSNDTPMTGGQIAQWLSGMRK